MTVLDNDKAAYTSREDEVDEEAQLLNEDYEQLELTSPGTGPDTASRHPPDQPSHRRRPSARSFFPRHRAPRWLAWLYGPDPPRIQSLRPWLPSVQELPVRALHAALPRSWHRTVLFALFLVAWSVSLAGPALLSRTPSGGGAVEVRHLSCDDSLWRPGNECGLEGVNCHPFANASFAFRCPRGCTGAKTVHSQHFVGTQEIEGEVLPPVVGGGSGSPFRGDSSICRAAIHAGVVDDQGGMRSSACGVVNLVGEYYQYFSSSANGVSSMGFGSHFPVSFKVAKADDGLRCVDGRWMSIPATVFLSMLLALFTTSPAVFFFTVFLGLFAQVSLLDAPLPSAPMALYIERLIPALLVALLIYHTCIRRTLSPPASASGPASRPATTNLTKLLLWLFPAWLSAFATHIAPYFLTDDSPARRVPTPVIAGLSVLLFIVLLTLQARTFYLESRLPDYLVFYAAVCLVLAILATPIPSLHVRPAHHTLAVLLLPVSAAHTGASMILQGLLTGVFVHGAATRGFGPGKVLVPITWFNAGLKNAGPYDGSSYGDPAAGITSEIPLPDLVPPLVERLSKGDWTEDPSTFVEGGLKLWLGWRPLKNPDVEFEVEDGKSGTRRKEKIAGVSVLINDVEMFRGWFSEKPLQDQVFRYPRRPPGEQVHMDEFFRFSFVTESGRALRYTEAGTWFANGTFSQGEGYW
ncbi:hypothetical protein VTJ83DRAFT_3328 [Remersonia thermophila]|uniref:LCCL domain-containing protein n=1 Tax=Remersonia thermophila TaxID=72144 RepID=A0ABR4DDZ4_9PEZI